MTAQFALPSVDSITYLRGTELRNKAINLSLCITVEKDKYHWYPDNEGKPCIFFDFGQEEKERWVYDREKDRDQDFDRITGARPTLEDN